MALLIAQQLHMKGDNNNNVFNCCSHTKNMEKTINNI